MVTPLSGLVVVVAVAAGSPAAGVGSADVRALRDAGATVGVLTDDAVAADRLAAEVDVVVWRVDPTNADAWVRVVAHIEQRLGPIDAIVVDRRVEPSVPASVRDDFRQRGHGGVLVLERADDPVSAVRSQVRTPR